MSFEEKKLNALSKEDHEWNQMQELLMASEIEKHPKELDEGENDRFLAPDPIEGHSFDVSDFTLMVMA